MYLYPSPPPSITQGGVGVLKTSLAMEFSQYFTYAEGSTEEDPPSAFLWEGEEHRLDNELWESMKEENVEEEEEE